MLHTHSNRCQPSAFTLLEVILALAILAGSVAVLGEVMSIAGRSAADAQAEAQAQLLASSVMDEILAGMADMTQQERQPIEADGAIPWVYSVTLGDTNLVGLTVIEVLVEQDVEKQFRPVKFRLVRWLPTETDSAEEDDQEDQETDSQEGDSNA